MNGTFYIVQFNGLPIRPATVVYPNGRTLVYGYGSGVDRVTSISDSGVNPELVAYAYLGLGSFVEADEPQPDLKYTLVGTAGGTDPNTGDIYRGLDRFGRVKDAYWRDYGSSIDAARLKYGYDRVGNRTWREDAVAVSQNKNFDELYAHDGLDRLGDMRRGRLNGTQDAITSLAFRQDWSLDATGNWAAFDEDSNGDGNWDLVQSRSASTANEVSGITNTTGSAWAVPAYDAAGNITTLPQPAALGQAWSGTYDAWNRLVKFAVGANTVQENAYDAINRRTIRKSYAAGGLTETRHQYYSNDWQVLEERLGSSAAAERQFIWGLRYIDDLLLRDRDTDGNGTLDERLYALQDANWNVVALADAAGTVVERDAYAAYGEPKFLTAAYAPLAVSAYDWEMLYAGYRLDGTGLYAVRHRALHPRLGDWTTRDPIAYRDGANLFEYVRSRPTTSVDPLGLQPYPPLYPEQLSTLNIAFPGQVQLEAVFGKDPTTASGMPIPRFFITDPYVAAAMDIRADLRSRNLPHYVPPESSTRALTKGERAMLRSVFGDHLKMNDLCVGKGGLFHDNQRNTMTPRYTPWFPPRNYSDDFSTARPSLRRHFIHEMTHVLQSQNGNWNWLDAPYQTVVNWGRYKRAYHYNRDDLGLPLYLFNFEQQADIVADFYAGRFSGEELKRCRRSLEGFQTQPPGPPSYQYPPGYPGTYDGGFPESVYGKPDYASLRSIMPIMAM